MRILTCSIWSALALFVATGSLANADPVAGRSLEVGHAVSPEPVASESMSQEERDATLQLLITAWEDSLEHRKAISYNFAGTFVPPVETDSTRGATSSWAGRSHSFTGRLATSQGNGMVLFNAVSSDSTVPPRSEEICWRNGKLVDQNKKKQFAPVETLSSLYNPESLITRAYGALDLADYLRYWIGKDYTVDVRAEQGSDYVVLHRVWERSAGKERITTDEEMWFSIRDGLLLKRRLTGPTLADGRLVTPRTSLDFTIETGADGIPLISGYSADSVKIDEHSGKTLWGRQEVRCSAISTEKAIVETDLDAISKDHNLVVGSSNS